MSPRFRVLDIRLLNLHYGLSKNQEIPANEHLDEDAVPVPVELLCNTNYDENRRLLRVTLAATIRDPKPTFALSAEIGGVFELDSEPDKETLERLRHIDSPAILFPYLREVISEITKRGGFSPLYLPPMNFVRIKRTSGESQRENVEAGQ